MQLYPFIGIVGMVVFTATASAQGSGPTIVNPGFEEGPATAPTGWQVPNDPALAAIQEQVVHSGRRAVAVFASGKETKAKQVLSNPGSRPMVVSAYVKGDDVEVNPEAQQKQYARLYIHVLYEGRPYSDASHFWVDLPTGSYDWRRVAVQVKPKLGLTPSEMWVSVTACLGNGTLYADDINIQPVQPFGGADARAWSRADDAILIADMSRCLPKTALSDKREHGHWKVLEYETPAFSGKCVWAMPETDAPPLRLPLNLSGWYAIYLGLMNHPEAGNVVRVKLTDDAAYQHRSNAAGTIQEVFFKCADMTGQDLHFAQQSAGYRKAGVVMYVKLVPLTDDEVRMVRRDARQRRTKRLIATIDGFSFIYNRMPTTKQELLEEFEHYRGTDFGTIWWQVCGADQVNYKSELGTIDGEHVNDFPRLGDRYYTEAVKALIKKGIDITQVAVEAAHSMDAKIDICIRPAAWQGPPPYEDYFTSDFYKAHPEWRCYDRDGTPVLRMSFAVPQVREHLLGIFREVLKAQPDGLNVLYNRGVPLILWEDAFCKMFKERYGEDAKQVPEDDQRIYELRGEIMTGFMRQIRELLDETQKAQGHRRRLELSAMVLETEEDNRKFGLDVERWVKEGLVDAIGVYKGAAHSSGKPIDVEYFKRITQGTDVRVYPCMVAWALPGLEDVLKQAVEWYDAGADGIVFWDPSGSSANGVTWPIISRLGHEDEVRIRAQEGKPAPVTLDVLRLGDYIRGRWSPWSGF